MNAPMLIRTSEEITGEWLGDVLGVDGLAVESIERIGTGQMSDSFRVAYSGGRRVTEASSSSSPPATRRAAGRA